MPVYIEPKPLVRLEQHIDLLRCERRYASVCNTRQEKTYTQCVTLGTVGDEQMDPLMYTMAVYNIPVSASHVYTALFTQRMVLQYII